MPKPFVPLTLAQFRDMLARFPFSRAVSVVHMHHTWRPNRAQYKGLASIDAMHEFHTKERGFSDIAQHITIAPDGTIWTGRNWNKAPASATGHNGSEQSGPFMFEMIGDFDTGQDPFDDPQRSTVLEVIAAVQGRFRLPPEALRFHRQMAQKSCPGTGIDLDEVVEAVRRLHGSRELTRSAGEGGPFSPAHRDDELTGVQRTQIAGAIDILLTDTSPAEAAAATELPESEEAVVFRGTGQITSAAARGVEVTAADLMALRPHVVNLNEGMLTESGTFSTLPEDVERIFGEDMEKAFADPTAFGMPPRDANEPFRIMIWAHGGLISEQSGLAIATKHLQFWKANGIYPIYFVWETGLMQTLGQLLRSLGSGGRDARNFFSDTITDPLIETHAARGGRREDLVGNEAQRRAGEHATRRRDQDRRGAEEVLRSACRRCAAVCGRAQRRRDLPRPLPPRGVRRRPPRHRATAPPRAGNPRRRVQVAADAAGRGPHQAPGPVHDGQGPGARRRLREGLSQVAAVPDPVLVREGRESGDSRAGGVAAPRPRRGAAVWPRRRPLGVCRRRLLAVGRQRWRPRLPFDHARRIRR